MLADAGAGVHISRGHMAREPEHPEYGVAARHIEFAQRETFLASDDRRAAIQGARGAGLQLHGRGQVQADGAGAAGRVDGDGSVIHEAAKSTERLIENPFELIGVHDHVRALGSGRQGRRQANGTDEHHQAPRVDQGLLNDPAPKYA